MNQRPGRPFLILPLHLLAGALLLALPALPVRSQQEGSGSVVIGFLTALDMGDIDAAMATWVPRPEVELSTGERYDTPETVRAYFESFPRPIEIVETLPWGGRRFEARVLAGGTPLLLTFEGAMGSIAYMYVEPDPSMARSEENSRVPSGRPSNLTAVYSLACRAACRGTRIRS